eukprot:scaffold150236_cov36-Tisochrysis_lutea.AAC.1
MKLMDEGTPNYMTGACEKVDSSSRTTWSKAGSICVRMAGSLSQTRRSTAARLPGHEGNVRSFGCLWR